MTIVITDAEVSGRTKVDVRLRDGLIVDVGKLHPRAGEEVIAADGGALLPGLHDHHIHLMALAAATASTRLGPPAVRDARGFTTALQEAARAAAAGGGWVRGVGYHESVAGHLDAAALDAVVGHVPVRIQHRSGELWILNSEALMRTGAAEALEPGIDRDSRGRATGRLWRSDPWLRDRVPAATADIGAVGRAAAAAGVTGFTDADPHRSSEQIGALLAAIENGLLPQRIHAMGQPGLQLPVHPRLTLGPVKVVLDDLTLPAPSELAVTVRDAHDEGRPVAIHCVTRVQLVVALAALADAHSPPAGKSRTGGADRIEHGSVIPPELIPELASLGVAVCTQPGFVAERGDQYLADVAADEQADLYRCQSLVAGGVAVLGGTDAPYTNPDPWLAMAAAATRRSAGGRVVGPGEAVEATAALRLFAGSATIPGTTRIEAGTAADVCLLATPAAEALRDLAAAQVVATFVAGRLVYGGGIG